MGRRKKPPHNVLQSPVNLRYSVEIMGAHATRPRSKRLFNETP